MRFCHAKRVGGGWGPWGRLGGCLLMPALFFAVQVESTVQMVFNIYRINRRILGIGDE